MPATILHLTPDTLALWFGRLIEMNSDELTAVGVALMDFEIGAVWFVDLARAEAPPGSSGIGVVGMAGLLNERHPMAPAGPGPQDQTCPSE